MGACERGFGIIASVKDVNDISNKRRLFISLISLSLKSYHAIS